MSSGADIPLVRGLVDYDSDFLPDSAGRLWNHILAHMPSGRIGENKAAKNVASLGRQLSAWAAYVPSNAAQMI